MAEILKVKLNDTQTLIADDDARPQGSAMVREVGFKVGPNIQGTFVNCSAAAASVLLQMLGRT